MSASDVTNLLPAAQANFERHLRGNRYPGRGLLLGRAEDGAAWLQIYWIMGRSDASRSRRFVAQDATLRTEPTPDFQVEDPSHFIYPAMLELPDVYLVTNGDQTRTLCDAIATGGSFEAALETREREADPPVYTPRISGLVDLRGGAPCVALSILKASPADLARTDRHTFRPAPPPPGFGLCLTTYESDGDPPPSFRGEPLWLPLAGDAATILATYWDALDPDNRVALALKRIPVVGGPGEIILRNRDASG